MSLNAIQRLLSNNGSTILSKDLARTVGIDAAILYAELVSKYEYFESREELTEDGFFFNTIENMERDTTLSKYKQLKAVKILLDFKLILVKYMGQNKLRYFSFPKDNESLVNALNTGHELYKKNWLSNNSTSGSKEIRQAVVKKLNTNNNKSNNNKNNNKSIKAEQALAGDKSPKSLLGNSKKISSTKTQTSLEKNKLYREMIDSFSIENKIIRGALNKYLEVRKSKGLTPAQWKVILEKLKEQKLSEDEIVKAVDYSILRNYMSIYAEPKKREYRSNLYEDDLKGKEQKPYKDLSEEEKNNFFISDEEFEELRNKKTRTRRIPKKY